MKFPGFESAPFVVEEFVPKTIFKKFGINSLWFVDVDVLKGMIFLRQHIFDAPIIINNWHTGGTFNYRGFRPSYYRPIGGGSLSQHYTKSAIDFNVEGLTSKEVSQILVANETLIRSNTKFTTIENPESTVGWTHIDRRWSTVIDKLLIVNP